MSGGSANQKCKSTGFAVLLAIRADLLVGDLQNFAQIGTALRVELALWKHGAAATALLAAVRSELVGKLRCGVLHTLDTIFRK
jgi:hypothetical protein